MKLLTFFYACQWFGGMTSGNQIEVYDFEHEAEARQKRLDAAETKHSVVFAIAVDESGVAA
jgi:hypothetical protein